jgi:hypothetical protein
MLNDDTAADTLHKNESGAAKRTQQKMHPRMPRATKLGSVSPVETSPEAADKRLAELLETIISTVQELQPNGVIPGMPALYHVAAMMSKADFDSLKKIDQFTTSIIAGRIQDRIDLLKKEDEKKKENKDDEEEEEAENNT